MTSGFPFVLPRVFGRDYTISHPPVAITAQSQEPITHHPSPSQPVTNNHTNPTPPNTERQPSSQSNEFNYAPNEFGLVTLHH